MNFNFVSHFTKFLIKFFKFALKFCCKNDIIWCLQVHPNATSILRKDTRQHEKYHSNLLICNEHTNQKVKLKKSQNGATFWRETQLCKFEKREKFSVKYIFEPECWVVACFQKLLRFKFKCFLCSISF